ncbi:MAG: hypothetical protein EZS28_009441 [Streblomastix strix]|uniref:Uncharacterized protein n=1 Tax=Streblomastix strix TaxID=222440 RepID=A0A5J4WKG8_9EUKA|nr:MAG: hypothetical protein EZS28_009441 [Streblomastix strix]
MILNKGTLTLQSESAVDNLMRTMSTNTSILSVVYSTDTSGVPLPMGPGTMRALCQAFTRSPSAVQFTASKMKLNAEDIREMEPLIESQTLQSLILKDCDIDDDEFIVLCTIILKSGHRLLRYLDLSGNYIGKPVTNIPRKQYDSSPGVKILARLLSDQSVMIGALNLSKNPLGNYGVHAIAQVLPRSSLRELNISNAQVTPNGCCTLLRVLRFSPSLVSLDLSHNILGFPVFHQLIEILPKSEIQNLNLRNTLLDNVSLISLGDALRKNTTLLELDISQNKFAKESVEIFYCGIKSIETFVNASWEAQQGLDDQPKSSGDIIEAFFLAAFLAIGSICKAIYYFIAGNWDFINRPNSDEDIIHLDTQRTLNILEAITISMPSMILSGYLLLVKGSESTIFKYLSFLGSIGGLSNSISEYLCKESQEDEMVEIGHIEASILWQVRVMIYLFLSLGVNVIRVSLSASLDMRYVAFIVILAAAFWFFFYLLIANPIGGSYITLIRNALVLTGFTILSNSETVFSSVRGRTVYFRWVKALPRFVFIIIDIVACVTRTGLMMFFLMIKQQDLPIAVVLVGLLMGFLDFSMIFLRIVLEMNGVSEAKKAKEGIVSEAQLKLENEAFDGIEFMGQMNEVMKQGRKSNMDLMDKDRYSRQSRQGGSKSQNYKETIGKDGAITIMAPQEVGLVRRRSANIDETPHNTYDSEIQTNTSEQSDLQFALQANQKLTHLNIGSSNEGKKLTINIPNSPQTSARSNRGFLSPKSSRDLQTPRSREFLSSRSNKQKK